MSNIMNDIPVLRTTITVKLLLFMYSLFHKFRNLGDFAKITGRKYSSLFSVLFSLASKNAKTKGANII